MEIKYRVPHVEEAQQFWDMMTQLDSETDFMLYEPGERPAIAPKSIQNIIQSAQRGDDFLMIAECDGRIAGYLSAQRSRPRRTLHSAYIVTGILKSYRGQGIGNEFFRRLLCWAHDSGITRLELTVMCHNLAAKHLYEKFGFVTEGTKKNSILLHGTYEDEYYMARISES